MKKWAMFIFAFLIVGVIVYAYFGNAPDPGHDAEEIIINVAGQNITLQEAINNRLLLGYNLNGVLINDYLIDNQGHIGSEILVRLSGMQKTLQEAINSGTLCSSSVSEYTSLANDPGHLANQTLVSNLSGSEKSLQEMINNKEFCTCGDNICQNSSSVVNYGENESNCYDDCYIKKINLIEEVKYQSSSSSPRTYRTCTVCNFGPDSLDVYEYPNSVNFSLYWEAPASGNYVLNCYLYKVNDLSKRCSYLSWYLYGNYNGCTQISWARIGNNVNQMNYTFSMPASGTYDFSCEAVHQSGTYSGWTFDWIERFEVN